MTQHDDTPVQDSGTLCFNAEGVATCMDPECGWTGVPTVIAGVPQPFCPSCDADSNPSRQQTVKREEPKVGRNDPCPCGSGKKYKKCHGRSGV